MGSGEPFCSTDWRAPIFSEQNGSTRRHFCLQNGRPTPCQPQDNSGRKWSSKSVFNKHTSVQSGSAKWNLWSKQTCAESKSHFVDVSRLNTGKRLKGHGQC